MSSNLRLINQTTVSGSTSSVNMENVFSSDFDNYQIIIDNATSDVNSIDLRIRFIDTSGNVIDDSNYDQAWLRMRQSGFNQNRIVDQNHIFFGQLAGTLGAGITGYIFTPFKGDCYTWQQFQASGFSGSEDRAFKGVAVLKEYTAISGYQIVTGGNNILTATIRTFGMRADHE